MDQTKNQISLHPTGVLLPGSQNQTLEYPNILAPFANCGTITDYKKREKNKNT